jgi:precorrin-4 methylase
MILFQAELVMNIHVNVSDIRDDVSKIREGIDGQVQPVSAIYIQSVEDRRILTVC